MKRLALVGFPDGSARQDSAPTLEARQDRRKVDLASAAQT
jgi:hypothetical protein